MSSRSWNVRLRRRGLAAAALGAALLLSAPACAGRTAGAAVESRFAAGNDAYEQGDYERAAGIYREIERSGVRSAALHYNLGNALFKAGRLGEALLEFEKALRLDPGDPDVRENLAYLRSLTVDEITPAPTPLAALGIEALLALTTPAQDAVVIVICWGLAWIAFGAGVAVRAEGIKRSAYYAAGALALPALLFGASLGGKVWLDSSADFGVVLASEADVLSGAGEGNPALFKVHEGLKVKIQARSEGWAQVSLENGLTGWLPEEALGEL